MTRNLPAPAAPALAPEHLAFLDGLRGIAALNVAFTHAWGVTYRRVASDPPPDWFMAVRQFFIPGDWSVCAFIVLSGFCLPLPIARNVEKQLPGGVIHYIKRRARRILPAYYAALALSLGV